MGNYQTARPLYEQSMATASSGTDDMGLVASCLEGLATVVVAEGELDLGSATLGCSREPARGHRCALATGRSGCLSRIDYRSTRSTWGQDLYRRVGRGSHHDARAGPRCPIISSNPTATLYKAIIELASEAITCLSRRPDRS